MNTNAESLYYKNRPIRITKMSVKASGNSVMGGIAAPIKLRVVWKNYKAKAITCTATQCSSYYRFLPNHARMIKTPKLSSCKQQKKELIELSV